MRVRSLTAVILLSLISVASSAGPTTAPSTPPAPVSPVRGALTVFADSSLTRAFGAVRDAFERAYPAVHVELTFGPSPTLARELQHGVPADVFATMDLPTLRRLVLGHTVAGAPHLFARNQMQIVVAADNPRRIRGLADLGNAKLVVATCRRTLPCGRHTALTFARAGATLVGSGQEQDGTAIIDRVGAGKADAGVVYETDLDAAGGQVQAVDIPDSENVAPWYVIALMLDTENDRAAVAFFTFVVSTRGQSILTRFGFSPP